MSLSDDPGAQRAAATSEAPAVFRLRGVTKRFGGVTAVENVDFDLRPGEVSSSPRRGMRSRPASP
jgi:hypothetical protein